LDPRFTTRILVVLAALGLAHKEEDRYADSVHDSIYKRV